MAVANITFGAGSKASKADIEPGWTLQESATSIDILDTSGSTGNVSASFVAKPQVSGQTPNTGPVPSSDFLLDQPCTFQHETLGSLNGYVTDQSLHEGVVDMNMSTVLDFLNQDITVPTFIEGSPFYSFAQASNYGTIYDMVVDSTGALWVLPNTTIAYKYDRWGNLLDQATFSGVTSLLRLGIDSSDNLYGMSTTKVSKWDSTARTSSVIITSAAGSYYDMDVNKATGMIYLLTTDTGTNVAVKKYNTSGTLQTAWGNYLSGTGGSAPTAGIFSVLQGIVSDSAGATVYVSSGTPLLYPASGFSTDIQAFSNTGTYFSMTNLGINTDFNDIRMEQTLGSNGANMFLTVSAAGINLASAPGNSIIINRRYTMPRSNTTNVPFGQLAIASDPNGSAVYVSDNDKIVRLAGGKMSPYQALECYLGSVGFGSTRPGQITYTNLTTSQINTFDGGYYPAWTGNLWSMVKQLAARSRFYITTSGQNIYVTSLLGTLPRIDISNRTGGISSQVDTASGRQVNVTNLNSISAQISNAYIYSSKASDSVISADYNEISTTTIATNSYPVAIDPILNLQGSTWSPVGSVYMVCDSSNPPLILSTGQFVTAGGSVTAKASDTLGSIDVTMTGPKALISGFTAPFSLAYPVGSQKVPALNISGNGVIVNPQVIQIGTGASGVVTAQTNTSSIDSPFINSGSVAYDTAQPACLRLGQGDMTLSFSIPLTKNHTLGNIAGSIFLYQRTKWRVASADISNGVIKITAKRFTTVSDVTPNSPTMTVAQMDALWSGYRYQDRFLSPGIVVQ